MQLLPPEAIARRQASLDKSESLAWAFPGKLFPEAKPPHLSDDAARYRGRTADPLTEQLARVLRETFEDEAFAYEKPQEPLPDDASDKVREKHKKKKSEWKHVKKLKERLDVLGRTGATTVYTGFVDDPRSTDNAWIETVAIHMHCPFDLGANLNLCPGKDVHDAIWVDVDDICASKLPLYASHVDWLERVKTRMERRENSLTSILVRWGRLDVAERVLKDPELLEHRQVMLVQPAFQQALQRAISERDFNVKLLDLLLDHGCSLSGCSLSELFKKAGDDPFLLLEQMTNWRNRTYDLRKDLLMEKQAKIDNKGGSSKWSSRNTTPRSGQTTPKSNKSPKDAKQVDLSNLDSGGIVQDRVPAVAAEQDEPGQQATSPKTVTPASIGLHDYSSKLIPAATRTPLGKSNKTKQAAVTDMLLESYPIIPGSPWHEEHIHVLKKQIGNFDTYARRSRKTHAFDVMICAICCGAVDLAKAMWKHSESPLRSALLAQDFCLQIGKFHLEGGDHSEVIPDLQSRLGALQHYFGHAAQNVLEMLPNKENASMPAGAAHSVLIAIPKPRERTCWHGVELLGKLPPGRHSWVERFCGLARACICKPHAQDVEPWPVSFKSVLDVAIKLDNKQFIAHSRTTNVTTQFWMGRSARCGKVYMRLSAPDQQPWILEILGQVLVIVLLFPVAWPVCRILCPLCHRCKVELSARGFVFRVLSYLLPQNLSWNDHYDWEGDKSSDNDEHSIDVVTRMLHFFLIPYVKRVLYISSQIAFTIFFCVVSFQPLCSPLNAAHYALGAWIFARAWDQIFHTIFHRKYWWRTNYVEVLEVASTLFLLVAACLRVSLAARAEGESPSNPESGACMALDDWRMHIYSGGCVWSPQYEALRIFLAFASIALFARCSEIFFVSFHARSGVLIIAACQMIWNMIDAYLGPFFLFTASFGVGLSFLAPDANRPENRTDDDCARPSWTSFLEDHNVTLSLALNGPFLAPFWGFYDLTPDPSELVDKYQDASFLTPFFIWIYLLVVLVLVSNLLIAMFNAKFNEANKTADAHVRMAKVHQLNHYIAAYPVPPPLNVPAMLLVLVYKVLVHLGSDVHKLINWAQKNGRGRKGKKSSPPRNQEAVEDRTETRPRRTPSQNQQTNEDAGRFECSLTSQLVEVCHVAWRSLLGRTPSEGHPKHYPPRLHLPDAELEALLGRARTRFLQKGEFERWRAEESTRIRFDKLQGELQDQLEQTQEKIERLEKTIEKMAGTIEKKLGDQAMDEAAATKSKVSDEETAAKAKAMGEAAATKSKVSDEETAAKAKAASKAAAAAASSAAIATAEVRKLQPASPRRPPSPSVPPLPLPPDPLRGAASPPRVLSARRKGGHPTNLNEVAKI